MAVRRLLITPNCAVLSGTDIDVECVEWTTPNNQNTGFGVLMYSLYILLVCVDIIVLSYYIIGLLLLLSYYMFLHL